jgi:hypothetical protein
LFYKKIYRTVAELEINQGPKAKGSDPSDIDVLFSEWESLIVVHKFSRLID